MIPIQLMPAFGMLCGFWFWTGIALGALVVSFIWQYLVVPWYVRRGFFRQGRRYYRIVIMTYPERNKHLIRWESGK